MQNYPEAKLTLYCWAMKILIRNKPHLEVHSDLSLHSPYSIQIWDKPNLSEGSGTSGPKTIKLGVHRQGIKIPLVCS